MSHSLNFFAPAQLVGYLAFVVGTTAFLQKNDRRLRFLTAIQGFVYGVHFVLLGAFPAAASSSLSGLRSLLSLKFRSIWLAAGFIALHVFFGCLLVKQPVGWFPVVGACVATFAIFTSSGIPMRLGLFTATLCWLTNNILTGSIGGTALEVVIATANLWTMGRLLAAKRACALPETLPMSEQGD